MYMLVRMCNLWQSTLTATIYYIHTLTQKHTLLLSNFFVDISLKIVNFITLSLENIHSLVHRIHISRWIHPIEIETNWSTQILLGKFELRMVIDFLAYIQSSFDTRHTVFLSLIFLRLMGARFHCYAIIIAYWFCLIHKCWLFFFPHSICLSLFLSPSLSPSLLLFYHGIVVFVIYDLLIVLHSICVRSVLVISPLSMMNILYSFPMFPMCPITQVAIFFSFFFCVCSCFICSAKIVLLFTFNSTHSTRQQRTAARLNTSTSTSTNMNWTYNMCCAQTAKQ